MGDEEKEPVTKKIPPTMKVSAVKGLILCSLVSSCRCLGLVGVSVFQEPTEHFLSMNLSLRYSGTHQSTTHGFFLALCKRLFKLKVAPNSLKLQFKDRQGPCEYIIDLDNEMKTLADFGAKPPGQILVEVEQVLADFESEYFQNARMVFYLFVYFFFCLQLP